MLAARLAAAATLLSLAAGAVAQTTPPVETGPAAQASSPVTQANDEAARYAADRNALTGAVNSARQAQYDADMAAYRRQVQQRRRTIARDQQRYDHQQRAYADAMQAWRAQVDACKRGHTRACKAPTPNPADFW